MIKGYVEFGGMCLDLGVVRVIAIVVCLGFVMR